MEAQSGEMLARSVAKRLPAAVVSSAPEDLAAFKVNNPLIDEGLAPLLAVKPTEPAELQELVKFANEAQIGLVPVSSRGPHFRGGIACSRSHIAVDLSAWKAVPFVNRRNRVCLIEPGVTYGELSAALQAEGMTISMPLAPRDGKSVIAAVMDREPSTWGRMQWDILDPVASTEFVFGTGDLFRTGAAGGPGSLERQRKSGGAQKGPLGPGQTDYQRVVQGAQGSIGIVTWVTLRCELKPTVVQTRLLGSQHLAGLIPYVYEVQRAHLGEHSFVLNRTAAAMLMAHRNSSGYDSLRATLPEYICLQNVAGFERLAQERVEYQMNDLKEIASRHHLSLDSKLGAVSADELLSKATTTCGSSDWRHALRGQCASLIMLSTLDRIPGLIEVLSQTAQRHALKEDRVGIYVQPIVQNHGCHLEFLIPYDPQDTDELARIRKFEADAVSQLNRAHAFFSRPYGAAVELAFRNNPVNTELLKKLKGVFDPNHVLVPGKFGF